MSEYHLTTVDNPFDPFEEFSEWLVFDTRHGYNTLELLDRIIVTSDDLAEADQIDAYNLAVDEIVQYNVSGVHRKVARKTTE